MSLLSERQEQVQDHPQQTNQQASFGASEEPRPAETQLQLVPGREEPKFDLAAELTYRIAAPIIVYPGGWGESITPDMQFKAKVYRLARPCPSPKMCTTYEVALYIMTASLCFPLDTTWYKIFMNVFAECFPEKVKDVQGDEPVPTLESYEESMLKELRVRIYQSQIKYLKAREKEQTKVELQEDDVQVTLFLV